MKILKLLDDHLEEAVIFLVFAAMSLIIGLQVIMRYVFQSSLSWSEEVARYLFIWLIYVGISYGVKKSAHISVTALDMVLSPRAQHIMKIVSAVVFLLFALVVVYYGRDVCARIARLGQEAPATGLHMWVVYAAVPTGFTLTCIRLIQRLYALVKTSGDANAAPE